jgi:uncharacterized LabA/DUF88 family protein
MKAGIFIDGTWFYYVTAYRRREMDGQKYAVSWQDLPLRILKIFGIDDVAEVFTFYSTSIENLKIGSKGNRNKKENFLKMLNDFGYWVEAYETSVCIEQGKEVHTEKCVDMAVGTELVMRSCTGDLDYAIVVSGDRDFYPAIDRANESGVSVGLLTSRSNGCKSLPELGLGVAYIEDVRGDIKRESGLCRCPDHVGPTSVFVDMQQNWSNLNWCDECLRGYERVCNG